LSNENYLRNILDSQNLTQNQIENLRNLRNKIEKQLKSGLKGTPRTYYGGSYKKNTMISASYDLDIVLYWSPDTPYTLQNLYKAVGSVLQRNWDYVHKKKVGWELPFNGDFHIDVIPGKESSTDNRYAYLYNNETRGRFQTSIEIQVNYVRNSKRQDTIRLMKLWKKRKNVPIKTFILEHMIIEGCKGVSRNTLEPQLNAAFKYLEENITTKKIMDPANSQNIISNDITPEEKNRIRRLATQALDADSWSQVFF
jgi:hypothetical protein